MHEPDVHGGRSVNVAVVSRNAYRDGTMTTAPPPLAGYPQVRMRRNRRANWSRRLVAENALTAADLIWPVFVKDGGAAREPIPAMPGVHRLTVEALVDAAGEAASFGIP